MTKLFNIFDSLRDRILLRCTLARNNMRIHSLAGMIPDNQDGQAFAFVLAHKTVIHGHMGCRMAMICIELLMSLTVSTTTNTVFAPRTIRQVRCLMLLSLLSTRLLDVGCECNLRSNMFSVARRLWTYSRSAGPRKTSEEGKEVELEDPELEDAEVTLPDSTSQSSVVDLSSSSGSRTHILMTGS